MGSLSTIRHLIAHLDFTGFAQACDCDSLESSPLAMACIPFLYKANLEVKYSKHFIPKSYFLLVLTFLQVSRELKPPPPPPPPQRTLHLTLIKHIKQNAHNCG